MGTGSLPEAWTASDYINLAQISEFFLVLMADFWQTECLYTFRCQDKHCKQVKCVISNQWSYIVGLFACILTMAIPTVVKCIVLLQDKAWQRLSCFFFYMLSWNKYALLSRNGLCREYALFWSCLDSDLTQISQIWLRYLVKKKTVKASGVYCCVYQKETSF